MSHERVSLQPAILLRLPYRERLGKVAVTMTGEPIDWDSPDWGMPGHNAHLSANGSDVPDRHGED